jgi:pimeloyl-ACP methyl ester carboxylesterase
VAPLGKVLLLIHGTFSNSEHLFAEIQAAPNGPDLLARALTQSGYKQILTFDHPTLSASPMVNAMDLRSALGASQADVDIICHSRGGLVSRWWMEVFDPLLSRKKRAVFVGSPLTGTSLAAPGRLRAGLKLLSTYATFLGNATMAAPLLNAPAALLRIFGSLASAAASVPLIDAGVAMIPGLNGQSRVANAIELLRLNSQCVNCPKEYFFVSSNFNPERAGWDVLKRVREIGIRTLNAAADSFVFPGDNDLVVDTAAMTEPWTAGIGAANSWKFDESASVHHTNYFRNRDTIEFITKSLV